ITKRLRAVPVRKCIRAETRMNKGEGRLEVRFAKIGIKRSDLFRRKHALVDDRSRRKAGEVELFRESGIGPRKKLLGPSTDNKQLSLKPLAVVNMLALSDKYLADDRFRSKSRAAEAGIIYGYIPPTEENLSFPGDRFEQEVFAEGSPLILDRQEKHA